MGCILSLYTHICKMLKMGFSYFGALVKRTGKSPVFNGDLVSQCSALAARRPVIQKQIPYKNGRFWTVFF